MPRTLRHEYPGTVYYLMARGDDGKAMFEGIGDSLFKSSYDRKIDSDTERMQDGKPLQHFPAERRLRLVREDRMIDEMMDD